MSEYLSKKAVLDSAKSRIEWFRNRSEEWKRQGVVSKQKEMYEASIALEEFVSEIQSGAFDAEQTCTQENPCPECLKNSVDGYKLIESELNTEVQRLRAALERIVTVYEECDCTAKDLYLIAVNEVRSKQPKVGIETHEALASTQTESIGAKGDGNDA